MRTFAILEPGGPPVAEIALTCERPDCDERFTLPADQRMRSLEGHAEQAGWSRHPHLGFVCHLHPYGKPIAALEADEEALERSRQASVTTGEWPIPTADDLPDELREAS